MKKKVLFAALALMTALALPQSAMAIVVSAVAPSGQTLYYNLGSNGKAMVCSPTAGWTESTKPTGDLVIPETFTYGIETYTVDGIHSGAFMDCTGLTSVTMPNSITYIMPYAFCRCSGLTSVFFSDSLILIRENAFYDCVSLTSVAIPPSVTTIGNWAFLGCSSITDITIPNSVTSIGRSPFGRCTELSSIVVENGNAVYDSRDNCNAIIETATNSLIVGIKTTTIPNSVVKIGSGAFSSTPLTTVSIPYGVIIIDTSAFAGCEDLTTITIPNSVTTINITAFHGCRSLCSINIPNSVTQIGYKAFGECSNLASVTLPDNIATIESSTFSECSNLTTITIPNSVTKIQIKAFYQCSGLSSIDIGSCVNEIEGDAFKGCSHMAQITCRAVIPPVVANESSFYQISRDIPLHVPEGSIDSYRTANVWSSFTNYQPINPEGINEVDGINAKMYSAHGQIMIGNADGNTVTLYDATGRILAIKQSSDQTITFDVPATGTYLVKVGNAPARRVVVVR